MLVWEVAFSAAQSLARLMRGAIVAGSPMFSYAATLRLDLSSSGGEAV